MASKERTFDHELRLTLEDEASAYVHLLYQMQAPLPTDSSINTETHANLSVEQLCQRFESLRHREQQLRLTQQTHDARQLAGYSGARTTLKSMRRKVRHMALEGSREQGLRLLQEMDDAEMRLDVWWDELKRAIAEKAFDQAKQMNW